MADEKKIANENNNPLKMSLWGVDTNTDIKLSGFNHTLKKAIK